MVDRSQKGLCKERGEKRVWHREGGQGNGKREDERSLHDLKKKKYNFRLLASLN